MASKTEEQKREEQGSAEGYAKVKFGELNNILQTITHEEMSAALAVLFRSLMDDVSNISKNDDTLRNTLKESIYDAKLYPELPESDFFEIREMINLIDDKGYLDQTVLHKEMKNNPLAQLLYILVWKNGQMNRFRLIKLGLLDEDGDKASELSYRDGFVFYQYARHIKDRKQPIIDQHTVRGMLFFKALYDDPNGVNNNVTKATKYAVKSSTVNKKCWQDYMEWVKKHFKEMDPDILDSFDKIMFTLGKIVKSRTS